jgi:hypothetical protein
MTDYVPLFESLLERKNIRYSRYEKVVVFFRKYSYDKAEVRMKFAFLLFPAEIEVVVSIPYSLKPEQMTAARLLIKKVNGYIFGGGFDCDKPNRLRFCGTFHPLVGYEWLPEIREQLQDFMIEYTTEIIPGILYDIFIQVLEPVVLLPDKKV